MIGKLIGKTLSAVTLSEDGECIRFEVSPGEVYLMHHHQECCEQVQVYDLCGELSDLVGSPVLQAECSGSEVFPDDEESPCAHLVPTDRPWAQWTFYRLSTAKGQVVIRWAGYTNYYSVAVDFCADGCPY